MMSKQGTGVLPSQMKYAGADQQMAATAETVLEEFAPTNVSTHEPVSNKQIRFTIGSQNFHQLGDSVWEFDITNKSNVHVRLDGGGCGLIQTLYIYSAEGVELERLEGAGMIATIEKQYTKSEHDLRELEAKEMFCGSLLEKSQRYSKTVTDQRFSPDEYPLLGANMKRKLQVHLPGAWFNPIMGRMLPPESTFQVHIDLAPANECLVYRETVEVPVRSELGLGFAPVDESTNAGIGFLLPGDTDIKAEDIVKLDLNGNAFVLRDNGGTKIDNPGSREYKVMAKQAPRKIARVQTTIAITVTQCVLQGNLTSIFFRGDILTNGNQVIQLTDDGTVANSNTTYTFTALHNGDNGRLHSPINAGQALTSYSGFASGSVQIVLNDAKTPTNATDKLRLDRSTYRALPNKSISIIKVQNGSDAVSLSYDIQNSKMIIPSTRLMDPALMQRLDAKVETLNWMGESYRRHVLSLEQAKGEQTYLIPIQARVLKGFSVVFQHTTERTKSYYYTNSQRTLNYVDQYQFTIGGTQYPRQPVEYKAGNTPGTDQSGGRHQDTLGAGMADLVLSEAWSQASGLWGSKGLVTLKDFTGSEDQLGTGVLAINLQTFGESMAERITSGMDLSLTPLPVNLSIRKVPCVPSAIGTGSTASIFGADNQTGTTIVFSHVLMAFKKDPVRGLTSRF